MMYRVMNGDGLELTSREVAELAMPNLDCDECADLRIGLAEWLFDYSDVDLFDAVMGRLSPLDLMERYVEYLTWTDEDALYYQFGVKAVWEFREPEKDLPLRFDMTLDPKCLDGPCERLDFTPLAERFGDESKEDEE